MFPLIDMLKLLSLVLGNSRSHLVLRKPALLALKLRAEFGILKTV